MTSGPALDFIDIVPANSFLGWLRGEAQAAWEAYVAHDFVRQLALGALPKTCFQYYLAQDYQFLRQYARAYALAAYKVPDLAQGLFTLFSPRLFVPKRRQSRRAERDLIIPNERQATPSGAVWGRTRRAWLFCAPAALSVARVV